MLLQKKNKIIDDKKKRVDKQGVERRNIWRLGFIKNYYRGKTSSSCFSLCQTNEI